MQAFDVTQVSNVKWMTAESIDYEYEHPDWGTVPSTCASWDPFSADIFDALSATLDPFVEPDPPTAEERLAALPPVSHAQMVAALIIREIITEAEGVDWIKGTLPAAVEAMIAALPEDRQIIARLRATRPTNVVPTDPLVTALAMAQGKTTEDMVELFGLANSL